jgi:hypothetical protein
MSIGWTRHTACIGEKRKLKENLVRKGKFRKERGIILK